MTCARIWSSDWLSPGQLLSLTRNYCISPKMLRGTLNYKTYIRINIRFLLVELIEDDKRAKFFMYDAPCSLYTLYLIVSYHTALRSTLRSFRCRDHLWQSMGNHKNTYYSHVFSLILVCHFLRFSNFSPPPYCSGIQSGSIQLWANIVSFLKRLYSLFAEFPTPRIYGREEQSNLWSELG